MAEASKYARQIPAICLFLNLTPSLGRLEARPRRRSTGKCQMTDDLPCFRLFFASAVVFAWIRKVAGMREENRAVVEPVAAAYRPNGRSEWKMVLCRCPRVAIPGFPIGPVRERFMRRNHEKQEDDRNHPVVHEILPNARRDALNPVAKRRDLISPLLYYSIGPHIAG